MNIYYKVTCETRITRENSHALLRRALHEYIAQSKLSLDADSLMDSMITTENGKPYFDVIGAPCFSISHSNDVWVVLFSEAPCGLDIQHEVKGNYDAIASKYYSAEETDALRTLEDSAKRSFFFDIWVRREAHIKALGLTVFKEPELTEPWVVRDVALPIDVHCAVCSSSEEEIIIKEL